MDAKEETAMNGTWKKGPGTELFAALERVGNAPMCVLQWYAANGMHI